MSTTVSEVLDLAADDIERNGWAWGPMGMSVDGPHCILGAIGSVSGVEPLTIGPGTEYAYSAYNMHLAGTTAAAQALVDYFGGADQLEGLPAYTVVYRWNDKLGRQQHEVVEALRAAAAVQRAYETEDQPLPLDVAA